MQGSFAVLCYFAMVFAGTGSKEVLGENGASGAAS